MKKILTLMALAAGAGAAFSQGIVNFNNNVFSPLPSNPDHSVYLDNTLAAGGTLLLGTQYSAELYAGADASSLAPLTASISKFKVLTTTFPGTWAGKSPLSLGASLGGVGIPVTLDIKVWDTTQAASYDEAALANGAKGKFGESGNFLYTQIIGSPTPGPSDTWMMNMPAFVVQGVPEPSAIALSVMGVAGLLLIRRRK